MLRQLQSEVVAWQHQIWPDYTDPVPKALKFAEEAGEVAGAVIKMRGGLKTLDDLKEELGDAVIALAALSDAAGVDLEAAVAARWAHVQQRSYGTAR